MRRILLKLVLPSLIGLAIVTIPINSFAWDPFSGVDCSQVSNSAVCNRAHPDNPIAGPDGVLSKITNIVALVAGIAAVIMILVGSIRYITSGGDANNAKSAKNTVLYALIGLVVIVIAKIIITFVVSKL